MAKSLVAAALAVVAAVLINPAHASARPHSLTYITHKHKHHHGHLALMSEFVANISAYTAGDPAEGTGSTAANGMPMGYGIAAVDPRYIPLGTRIYVPGYGTFIAADTGGAIVGHRIDLCFGYGSAAYAKAINFGHHIFKVYLRR